MVITDVVAYLVGLEQENEYTSGKVLKCSAESHADGNAGRGEDGEKRGRLDAYNAYYGDYQYEIKNNINQTKHERTERPLDVVLEEDCLYQPIDFPDYEAAYVEHYDCDCQIYCERHGRLGQAVDEVFERERFQLGHFLRYLGGAFGGRNRGRSL